MQRGLVLAVAMGLLGCRKVPETGRRQLQLVPEVYMNDLGAQSYREVRQEGTLITDGADVDRLQKVADRIAAVAAQDDYKWKATLFQDNETVNAWCMPGGKIGFYTGILPVLENEAGMAFVMGHEVAHAVLRHGAERMSQQLVAVGGLEALNLYINNRTAMDPDRAQLILAVLGLGAQYGVLLPYSRLHESEADEIGLLFMARAGYPPQEATQVWNRMEKESGRGLSIEFLSTHPSYDTRRENLRTWMKKADRKYEANRTRLGGQDPLQRVW